MSNFRCASLLAAIAVAAAPAWAQTADRTYHLSIPRETLDAALKDFARQTGLQVARVSDMVDGSVTVGPLSGDLSAQGALQALLAPSGLTFKVVNDRTIAVLKANASQRPESRDSGILAPAGAPTTSSQAEVVGAWPVSTAEPTASGPEASEQVQGQPSTNSDQVTITGSRIRTSNPTAPLIVIDRDMIEKNGFSTVEDIVRWLPQNLSTTNVTRSLTQPVAGDNLPVGPAAQGESAANLRGLGQGATLVLIDGHRTSGSAAFAGESVNLSSIPAVAIERVEVLTDSAAAVYGSDAIGGVINIVLRKNYSGSNTTLRYEDGENGGDKVALDQLLGFSWSSGNVTATFSDSHQMPIDSRRAGYSTNNLTSRGGVDGRSPFIGQPGAISSPDVNGSLPGTFSGAEPWTAADISPANFRPGDLVPSDYSSDVRSRQFYVAARQTISDSLEGFADVRWSDNHNSARTAAPLFFTDIDAGNPYNHLGESVFAEYVPIYEITHGLIATPIAQNTLTSTSVDIGGTVKLPVRDWKLDITGTYSTSRNKSGSFTYEANDPSAPDGLTPFGRALPLQLNPFGNGTDQNLAFLKQNYGFDSYFNTDRKTILDGVTVAAEGSAVNLPGGDLRIAAGGEFRHEALSYAADDYIANQDLSDRHPSQDIGAVFGEASVPILKSLTATLQGRWERYSISSTNPVIDGKTFSKLTPRFGLAWHGPERFVLHASWGKSFKAPGLNDLAIAAAPAINPFPQYDPIKNETVPVYFDSVANPHLQPEEGETVTAGLLWSPLQLEGLQFSATFNRTRFFNQIQGSLLNALGTISIADALAQPNAFPTLAVRAPDGTLLRIEDSPVNLSSLTVRSVDFNINYDHHTPWGDFSAVLQGVVTLSYDSQLLPLVAPQDLAGTTAMDKRRASLSLGWSRPAWGVNILGNYTGPYLDTEVINLYFNAGPVEPIAVPSRVTWDLSAFYNAPWGIKLSGGVKDLFDASFPFAQGADGPFDSRRVDLRGRVIHVECSKAFRF